MLLNQCLAISLSPTTNNRQADHDTQSGFARARTGQKTGAQKTTTKATSSREINQTSASQLFRQLVEQNSLAADGERHKPPGQLNYKLNEVFKRVDFAGFVLPSWLLLSGTYDDLHCIKSHWAAGRLRSPPNLRIETIGNIRSVNVDYFGGGSGDGGGHPMAPAPQEAQTGGERQQLLKDSRSHFSPLETKILNSIDWLLQESGGGDDGRQVSLERVAAFVQHQEQDTGGWPGGLEAIERAARSLTRAGRLVMTQTSHSGWLVAPAEHPQPSSPPTVSQTSGRNSVASAKSKSTTLDSGLGGGGRSSTTSDELPLEPGGGGATHQQQQQQQLAILEKAAPQSAIVLGDGGASLLGRAPRSTSREHGALQQSQRAQLGDQPPQPPREQVLASGRRRRGFSLTRSFSFRVNQQQHQRQHAMSSANDRSGAAAEGEPRRWPAAAAAVTASDTNRDMSGRADEEQTTRQRRQNANLSSLFRSKSMRAVSASSSSSSSTAGSKRATPATTICDKENLTAATRFLARSRPTRTDYHNQQQQQQATIDYLGDCNAAHIKRSFSVRRNSLLTFGKDELGGGAGKIALFLRKLFSVRRQRRAGGGVQVSQVEPPTPDEPQSRIHVDIQHHHHHRQSATDCAGECACQRQQQQQPQVTPAEGRHKPEVRPRRYHDFVASSPSFDDHHEEAGRGDDEREELVLSSPSQNSLIEILDCSRRLDRTRRDLRQEEARSSSASRATWRLIKRSESSLSQQSNASCSTNRSTVSQQLRRHLDEAYRRHRSAAPRGSAAATTAAAASSSASSKRERDFIDSINVLRQASRHASLETSRASSKNRRHHHSAKSPLVAAAPSAAAAAAATAKSGNEDLESQRSSRLDSTFASPVGGDWSLASSSAASSKDATSLPPLMQQSSVAHDNNQTTTIYETRQEAAGQEDAPLLPLAALAAPDLTSCVGPLHEQQQQQHQLPLAHQQACACYYCCLSLVNNNSLGCCAPPPVNGAQGPPPLPACCLALQQLTPSNFQVASLPPAQADVDQHHHNQQQQQQHNNHHTHQNQLAFHHPSAAQINNSQAHQQPDLGCPIWRSMLMSYCQQQHHHEINGNINSALLPPPHPFGGLVGPASLLDPSQELARHGLSTALARSPSVGGGSQRQLATALHTNQQQHQQQLHNTTIDLKIEIGADFKKLVAGGGSGSSGGKSSARARREQKPAAAAAAAAGSRRSSTTTDEASASDSLDERRPSSDCCDSSSSADSSLPSATATKFIITSDNKIRPARPVATSGARTEPTSDMTTSCDDSCHDSSLQSAHEDDSLGATVNRAAAAAGGGHRHHQQQIQVPAATGYVERLESRTMD